MSHCAQEVIDCHEELKRIRALEEPQWREIAALFKPEETDIGTRNQRTRVADDLLDSTSLIAADQFVGGLFNQAVNPADDWFDLGLGDKDLAKWGPVQNYLWSLRRMVRNTLEPAVSNFYSIAPASFADLGVFGLGSWYSDWKPGDARFTDIAIPMSETYIDTDGTGQLIRFHREWRARGVQLKAMMGDNAPDIDDRREVYVIHAVYKNPAYRKGARGKAGFEWLSTYCSTDVRDWRRDGGYYELPFQSIPWTLRSGRVYPIGPGHLSRPDGNTLQEMERSTLVGAQFAAEPLTLVNDQGVITAADITPNNLLYGAVNEDGKPLVQAFNRGADVKLTLAQAEQRRNAIKEVWLFSVMQLINRPQMTATEFLGFKEHQLSLMAPNLTRIHAYGLAPFIARRVKLLSRAGMLPPPPDEMRGHNIEIAFTSPLAKAQKAAQGRATLQWVGAIGQMAQFDPEAADQLDADAAGAVLRDAFGPPPEVRRSDDAIAARRQARAQEQAQMAALAKAQAATATLADGAHAMQAATAARERVNPGQAA